MIAQQPVSVETWAGQGVDAHGRTVDSWAPPVERLVFGWEQVSAVEPVTVGAERIEVDARVFAPFALSRRDRVTLPIGRFEVDGECEDWNHGPFGYQPGFVWNLKRVSG